MKLSFSTRGWMDLSWEEMMQAALDMGFSGIEVYNLPKMEAMLDRSGPFHKYQTAATVRQQNASVTEPQRDRAPHRAKGAF